MNDPRRPGHFSHPLSGSGPIGPLDPRNVPCVDPAYATQPPYAPRSVGQGPNWDPTWAPIPNETDPTTSHWQQGQPRPNELPPPQPPPPPPGGPKSPRWLWIAATAAVLLVVALVVALVIANGAVKNQTAVPPLPAMPGPSSTTSTPAPGPSTPTQTTSPVAMQTVVYSVIGQGRAISITYLDTGDIIQTEFNVALPWNKEVSLSKAAIHPASVTIVNIGHNVTCSVTVAGVQMHQRIGMGITICEAAAG